MTAATRHARRTVLVADDTAFVRDRFKAAIEAAGHNAVAVQTGQEFTFVAPGGLVELGELMLGHAC